MFSRITSPDSVRQKLMTSDNTATIQALLQFALPLGSTLVTGSPDATVNWSVNVRAQPPAFPEIYGGELAFISMQVLRSYDSRITLVGVIEKLAEVGIKAVASEDSFIDDDVIELANKHDICVIALPPETSLTALERAVNTLIVNQSAQLNQRAIEIQRQLTRHVAENRDLNSLLQIIARATAKPVLIHDDAGVLMAQVYPSMARRTNGGRTLLNNLPYSQFQTWLEKDAPLTDGAILPSPLGHTTVLKVEKRVAGYLSLVDTSNVISDFDRLVLAYSADVCAIEIAKNRAIASAVEQTRGDWVQMWLSGTPTDDDLMATRATQAGFDINTEYVVAVFKATTESGTPLPLDALIALVRDDMSRRQYSGAIGQYVDVIVALYPLEESTTVSRIRVMAEEVREQLALRSPSGIVGVGISRPAAGLAELRDAYREAKDALSIAAELGERGQATYYGDLKLYQLLLALKEGGLEYMHSFYHETLGALVEHDERKQSDLIRTLSGFFEANGNLAKAANDLDVHRNTLVYRLERISELTGLNLDDADNRLILHLSLKIQRVLATMPIATSGVDGA
jgi:PucR family transcriptional regulator, purine catabolism regulatory protein